MREKLAKNARKKRVLSAKSRKKTRQYTRNCGEKRAKNARSVREIVIENALKMKKKARKIRQTARNRATSQAQDRLIDSI